MHGRVASRLDEVMRHAAEEAAGLLHADGAFVDHIDDETGLMRTAHMAGIADPETRRLLQGLALGPGEGIFGIACAERRVAWTGDYLGDPSFAHAPGGDDLARRLGIVSVAAAPLLGEAGDAFGILAVFSSRRDAFDEAALGLVRALADHAAAEITTRRLIEELAASRDELQHRVDAERSLREIMAGVMVLRDTDDLLQRVVDEASRLLSSDGAHMTLRVPGEDALQPLAMAGPADAQTREWLRAQRFPAGSGLNALAATVGEPVWTNDYQADQRIPHDPEDVAAGERMGLASMAVVPMRGHADEVLGTLTISFRERGRIRPDHIGLLQALADRAAIALLNSRLLERLRASEARYRRLVERSPDLVFTLDAEGRFTFVSDRAEELTGWPARELVGRDLASLVAPGSAADLRARWAGLVAHPDGELRVRLMQRHRSGRLVPVEIRGTAVTVDGRFGGMHAAARDISDSDRLEREMRRQAADLASAQERAHLARELHDSVTQALFSMTLTTRTVELLVQRDPAAARQHLGELRDLQRDALAEMRALVFALRPGSLEKDGLVQALKTTAAAIEQRTDLPVRVDAELPDRLRPELEDALYRIAQEALHNVVKHAQCSRVTVTLRREPDLVRLRVEDDGAGFDESQIPSGHLGIAGMRARALLIGARITVRSAIGEGTSIEVVAPIGGEVAADERPADTDDATASLPRAPSVPA